jgi:integrase
VSVVQTLAVVDYAIRVSEPKTAKGRPAFALDVRTVAVLRQHKVRQTEERLAVGPGWEDTGLVFTTVAGGPIHPERFSDWFDQHIVRGGVRRIRLHALRHTHATLALGAGVHPKVVSERLGHANVSITLDLYSHVTDSMQVEAAERISKLVFGT